MTLGAILTMLREKGGADEALAALGDLVLYARVRDQAAIYDETPGEYAAGAVSRFAASASDEDWLALMTAMEKSRDPAATMLEHNVRWSLAQEAAPEPELEPEHVAERPLA
jgi:hypothetical protein